ncbi:NACHT domain-containing protein [Dapis sp. BLCC M172]|uniref:NACHT domain-containing protein n=1 Tax=Dapis sp. BLCC M172 TaxID=2975281 RepID=UPI003CFB7629
MNGNKPVYLYDIYFPLNLQGNAEIINTDKISNLFVNSNFVTIFGSAGSGKSTLVKHLFINSIVEKYGIPILIEFRYLNDYSGSIENYITEVMFENQVSQSSDILNKLLKTGKFVFFLDGFDELNNDIERTRLKQLTSFLDNYNDNKYILTSRPYTNVELLPLFHNYQIETLSEEQVKKFIKLQLNNEDELSQKITQSVENTSQTYIKSFLSNPLLLSLYILTFQSNPDIPHKKYIFYRRVVQALFTEHDSKSKLGYIRQRRSKLNQEQFEEVLKRFSFLTFFDRKYTFDLDYVRKTLGKVKSKLENYEFSNQLFIDDLKLGLALWVEDGNRIQFAHKSLQEYFVALFITDLNIEQKNTIYSKIIIDIGTLYSTNEWYNFLSLCEEMDKISYSKLFLLPVINKVINSLSNDNDEELISKIVNESYSSIDIGEHSLTICSGSYKINPLEAIREIKPQFIDLRTFLSNKINYIMDYISKRNDFTDERWTLKSHQIIHNKIDKEAIYSFNLNPLPEDILIHLKEEGIIEIIGKVKKDLVNLRSSTKKFVEGAEKANDELIDMI